MGRAARQPRVIRPPSPTEGRLLHHHQEGGLGGKRLYNADQWLSLTGDFDFRTAKKQLTALS